MKTMTEMLTGVPAVLALATVALLADGAPVASRDAPEPPPGGYPEIYRLMYVTEEGFNADEPDISWYNNKVNDIANNLNGETGSIVGHLRVRWWCIGSTSNVSARQNTKTYKTSDVDYDAAYDVPNL